MEIFLTVFGIEFILGLFSGWLGIYIFTRHLGEPILRLFGIFLISQGFLWISLPAYGFAEDLHTYYLVQRILDFPLFLLAPILFQITVLAQGKVSGKDKVAVLLIYAINGIFYIFDLFTQLVVNREVLRHEDFYKNFYFVFKQGPLLIPVLLTNAGFFALIIVKILSLARQRPKEDRIGYYLAIGTLLSYAVTALFFGIGYQSIIPYLTLAAEGSEFLGSVFLIFAIMKYGAFVGRSRPTLDKEFVYATIVMLSLLSVYAILFLIFGFPLTYRLLIFVVVAALTILLTHSLYDWIMTFIRDISYNLPSGLSVATDQEVARALRSYSRPEQLEDSQLIDLKIVQRKLRSDHAKSPVDALRKIIEETIQYFKPIRPNHRRTRQNLKYHFLKMFAFDQAEEGQILWELGFEEYPTRILSQEDQGRKPKFITQSPADYTATSRNAFINLKQEAIHDVTWRISYLEKLSRRKL